ncbi:DsbA family oxidoreductase [Natrononativus amylolyticus]|uniref:DsbA family oxidoreductase n=1 Tax=Natrononativus amylolyticus TaxID=2963434 RepID=UPI0020CDB955|nr:DsbA family protein [Natrononativus amylolyticus]
MSDSSPTERVTVYADYVCPFCYLGRRVLDRVRADRERPLAVDWHPFDLRYDSRAPDGSIERAAAGKDEAYYDRARENVRRLQERYDVEMDRELATDVDSRPAQLASLAVREREPERWEAFDGAVYGALWRESRDIGDPAVLADLLESVGFSESTTVAAVLEDDELSARLDERFVDARRTGVTGVPTFVVDGHVARGAVSPEHLERLLDGSGSNR